MELRYKMKKGVISLMAVGLLMVCTSTLMFVHNPLQSIIKMILTLSDGNLLFLLWSNPPYDVYLKFYLFNITNPKEFLSGKEKMNVTEIGPYVYQEVLTNNNATFNDTDGTVTYIPHREIIFVREKSVGDENLNYMLTTNLPLVGFQAFLRDSSYFANVGFATAARMFGSEPIMNISVHDYLFGYKDKFITYGNKLLPHWIDFDEFGIFARLLSRDNNNTVTVAIEPSKYHSKSDYLLTEEEQMSEYHVVRWNGLAGLKDWGYENLAPEQVKKCHLVEGTFDGTVFPRNLRPNRTLTMFRKAFCRPVPLHFTQETISKDGFRQYEYKLADNMFDVSKENECFCYQNKCIKGFQSIAPCYYGMPITLSQPHFLNADPEMLKTVNGLNPKVEEHGSVCAIQPDVGAPLSGSLKIQVNLDVGQTKGNHKTLPFNNLQVPLFWVEINTDTLPFIVLVLLHLTINALPVLLEIAKYLFGLGGLALISGATLYTLLKARVRIPGSISLNNSEYSPIPIISIPAEFLEKCEKRFSLKSTPL